MTLVKYLCLRQMQSITLPRWLYATYSGQRSVERVDVSGLVEITCCQALIHME